MTYSIGDIINLKNINKLEKVSIFIDAEYVIQSMRVLKHKPQNVHIGINDIFWDKFIERVLETRTLNEVIYYSSELDKLEDHVTYIKQKEYLSKLRTTIPNISIRLGKMQKVKIKAEKTWSENNEGKHNFIYTWIQKGIDVKMTIDLITKAVKNEYETAILVAGDSDFEEVIREIKSFNKKIELVTFERHDAGVLGSLIRMADVHTKITYEGGKHDLFKVTFRSPGKINW